MKEMKDMEFIELLEWVSKNENEITNEQWAVYESQAKKLAPKYFVNKDIVELMDFYRKYAGDNLDHWWEAWDNAVCESHPIGLILERIGVIERSVSVLLKEHDHEPAKITIGQLNRLKGGM